MSRWGVILVGLGAGIVALVAAGLQAEPPGGFGSIPRENVVSYIECALAAGALYAAAVWVVCHRPLPAWTLPAALALGLVARLLVLVAPPILSTDIYRYVWDGRVQAAGINPYRYLPNDPALAALRDPPTEAGATAIYPNINRVDTAPTIYPPAAQAVFALVGLTAPSIWTMKAVMMAFDLAAAACAMLLLRAARRPMIQALIWAWNPLVIWEFAGAGHIDAAAAAATGLALLLAIRARPALAGAALAVGVLFKLLPAALFPALWRPWNWRTPLVAAALILASYAAYAAVGWRVFGYLPGYAREERLDDGGGALVPRLLALAGPLPHWTGVAYALAALALLAGLAAWVAFRAPWPADTAARAEVIGRDALLLAAATIAVLSPHYPWYLTMLVLPAVLCPAWSVLWPSLAGPLLYLDPSHDTVGWAAIVYLPTLPLLAVDLYFRRRSPAPAQGGP